MRDNSAPVDAPAAAALESPPAPPELRDEVAAALEEIRRDEKIAGLRAGLQTKRDRLDGSMEYLDDERELNDDQSAELHRALVEQYDREDALITMVERGVADDLVGRQKAGDVQMFTDAVASFLTEEQVAAFWQIVENGG